MAGKKKLRMRSPRPQNDSTPAEHTDESDNMVKMVAVYKEDGGIKAFVPKDSFDSKQDEFLESSSDDLAGILGKSGSNAGSGGWISQTIAMFNKARGRTSSVHSQASSVSSRRTIKQETFDSTQQNSSEPEIDILKDLQSDVSEIQSPCGTPRSDCHRQEGASIRQFSSLSNRLLSENNMSEYMDAATGIALGDIKDFEEIINNMIDAKLSACVEKCDMEMQAVRSEQEQILKRVVDDVMNQVDARMTEMCSKLEQKCTDLILENNANELLDTRIKDAIEEAKAAMQVSIKQDVDAKLERMASDIHDKIEPQMESIDEKLQTAIILVNENESLVHSMSDTIMEMVDSKLQGVGSKHDLDVTEFQETVNAELDDCKNKNVQCEQKIEDVVSRIESLKGDLDSIESKLQKHSSSLMDELTRLDSKWDGVVNKEELDDILENVKTLCTEVENKAVGIAAQECDEKLGVWAMDMEDKLSQDFYRMVEDRVQDLSSSLLKQLTNTIEQKLRGLGGASSDGGIRELSPRSGDAVVMGTDADSFVKTLRSTIQAEIQKALEPITPGKTETVDNGGVVKNIVNIMEQCEKQVDDATVASTRLQELNKNAMEVVEQMKKYIALASSYQQEAPQTEGISHLENVEEVVTTNKEVSNIIIDGVRSISEDGYCNVYSQQPFGQMVQTSNYTPASVDQDIVRSGCMENKDTTRLVSGMLCGMSVPQVRSARADTRCSTLPMELVRCQDNAKMAHYDCTFTGPSQAVEVKYVNINGQVMKVTQEHLKLSQAFGDFHKFVKGNGDEVIGVIKKSKLGDKTAGGVYEKIRFISDLIKTKCNFVDSTANPSELVVSGMDGNNLLDMIKGSVDAMEEKLKLVKEIAETVYDKDLFLANWFVDFGIVSNEIDIKGPLTADLLKHCYDPLIKKNGELSQLKNILDGKPPKDSEEEEEESDHEDCPHPDHHGGVSVPGAPQFSRLGPTRTPRSRGATTANSGSVAGQTSGDQGTATTPSTGSVSSPGAQPVSTPTQEATQTTGTVNSKAQTAPSAPAPPQGKNLTQATEQNAGASQSGFNALAIGAMSVMLLSVF
ncbi:chromosome segregation ATPase, putative [Babesia ovis]|uniref:Chromosome segregation ATPase, putative n=1 Tax=Babesia ovis TaxID=5869 RepID=A0A9W5WW34_BABOV|nr:chromosome segregation ATPase, putative [Babesia ovis]